MCEILFRGKAITDDEWVEGSLVIADGRINAGRCYILPTIADFSYGDNGNRIRIGCFVEVDPDTIGQYTGLKDKNGKKIFEGDIFRFPDEVWESYYTSCGTEYNSWEVENYGVVGFCDYSGRFDFIKYKFNENSVEADLHENREMEFYEFVTELEIIGNIHDNPELLGADLCDR